VIDLDAYCARIGYDGPRTPGLETLRALHALHPAAIPFEAFDVLTGRGFDISPEAVDAKLIGARRGGYCFEQNGLFKRALTAMGFAVEGLAARVLWGAQEGALLRARSHMALRVTLDGEAWLADVGFGGAVLSAPLRFAETEPQATPLGTFRLTPRGRDYLQELDTPEGWSPLLLIGTEPHLDVDYVPYNWVTSTHPDSPFDKMLMLARAAPEARYAVMNNRLTIRHADGRNERRELTLTELEAAVRDLFGLEVTDEIRCVLARFAT
jgi:N-hydroxyarylamine O-acetyltransferase